MTSYTNSLPGRAWKQSPIGYYLLSVWRSLLLPRIIRRWQRNLCLKGWEKRGDADEIRKRVEYYNSLPEDNSVLLPTAATGQSDIIMKEIGSIKLKDAHSRYWFDLMRYLRSFPKSAKAAFINGDTWKNPEFPVLCKARRIDERRSNCVLLNMDRLRHFTNVEDYIPFENKENLLFFRGDIKDKPHRIKFFEMWARHAGFNLGDTASGWESPWPAEKVSIPDHFRYKYILALEGNDVATAVQWICQSNCIPVMTRPSVESWLMHGAMIPGVHYIEIKPDFSDVAEKIDYYNAHPEEARRISEASKEWIARFSDPKRESIISYLVVERYLAHTNPVNKNE